MWHAGEEDLECTHAQLSWLWRGAGPRSQRSAQYPARSAFVYSRRYRGAHGNRQACPVKRFRTGDLYCWISNGQWQAPWMKEEPPASNAGECQYDSTGGRYIHKPVGGAIMRVNKFMGTCLPPTPARANSRGYPPVITSRFVHLN